MPRPPAKPPPLPPTPPPAAGDPLPLSAPPARPGGELPEVATSAMLQMRGLEEVLLLLAFMQEDC